MMILFAAAALEDVETSGTDVDFDPVAFYKLLPNSSSDTLVVRGPNLTFWFSTRFSPKTNVLDDLASAFPTNRGGVIGSEMVI